MQKKLSIGDKALDFTGMTGERRKVGLRDCSGKPLWLIFYRYATCPLCNSHLFSIPFHYEAHKAAGLEVFAIFESPLEKFPDLMNYPTEPRITPISDPSKEIYSLYATESKLSGVFRPGVALGLVKAMASGFKQGKPDGDVGQLPAHFLISEKGVVEDVHYGRHIDDHISWERVEAFLARRAEESRPQARKSSR